MTVEQEAATAGWAGKIKNALASTVTPEAENLGEELRGKHSARRFPPCYYLIVKDSAGDGVSATG